VRLKAALGTLLIPLAIVAYGIAQLALGFIQPEVVVDPTESGHTYQLLQGQVFRLRSEAGQITSVSKILTPLSSGSRAFRATATGVGVVSTDVACGSQWGHCTAWYPVVVTNRRFDLALSDLDSGSTRVVKVGEEIVFGYPLPVTSSDPSIVGTSILPASFGPTHGVTVFRTIRSGQARLNFAGPVFCFDAEICQGPVQAQRVTLIVSSSPNLYDVRATQLDAGKTLRIRKGQTLEIVLPHDAQFDPWRLSHIDYQDKLQPVVEDGISYARVPTKLAYLAATVGTTYLTFSSRRIDCRASEDCPIFDRTLDMAFEVEP
jgi:hypothetical protein